MKVTKVPGYDFSEEGALSGKHRGRRRVWICLSGERGMMIWRNISNQVFFNFWEVSKTFINIASVHGPRALSLLINIRVCRDNVFGECSLACAFSFLLVRHTETQSKWRWVVFAVGCGSKNLPEAILPPIGGNIKTVPDHWCQIRSPPCQCYGVH